MISSSPDAGIGVVGNLTGMRYEDWVLDDPAGQDVEAVRPIRDEIERRVRHLLGQLDVPASS